MTDKAAEEIADPTFENTPDTGSGREVMKVSGNEPGVML